MKMLVFTLILLFILKLKFLGRKSIVEYGKWNGGTFKHAGKGNN